MLTREEWLNNFILRSIPHFDAAGYEVPSSIRASIGFTSMGRRSKRIGECWSKECSEDGTFEIFIVPTLSDPSRIADILTHEIIHAVVGLEAGHKKPFVDCMKAMGLEGKPTATVAGDKWREWAEPILEELGPLPHAAMSGGESTRAKKQTTRMLKCECPCCGFTFRTTSKWLEGKDSLICPDPGCGTMWDVE